jgi:hypothetical protein
MNLNIIPPDDDEVISRTPSNNYNLILDDIRNRSLCADESDELHLPLLYKISTGKSKLRCVLCKNKRSKECTEEGDEVFISVPKAKKSQNQKCNDRIEHFGALMMAYFKQEKDPCKLQIAFVRLHHFHPLLRKQDTCGVWSYICDENIATRVYGGEEEHFRVPDFGDHGCWFVFPNFIRESAFINVVSPRRIDASDEAIEISVDNTANEASIELCLGTDQAIAGEGSDIETYMINLVFAQRVVKKALFDFVDASTLVPTLVPTLVEDTGKMKFVKYLEKGFFGLQNPCLYKKSRRYELRKSIQGLSLSVAKTIMPGAAPDSALALYQHCLTEEVAPSQIFLAKLGIELMKIIALRESSVLRRPLMSIACKAGISRAAIESLLPNGMRVHHKEWAAANVHALFPGPGESVVKTKYHRKKCKDAALDRFLQYLADNNLLQDLSYGHKEFKTSNGIKITIPSVKGNEPPTAIVKRYMLYVHSIVKESRDWEDTTERRNGTDEQASLDDSCLNDDVPDLIDNTSNIDDDSDDDDSDDDESDDEEDEQQWLKDIRTTCSDQTRAEKRRCEPDQTRVEKRRCQSCYRGAQGIQCLKEEHSSNINHQYTPKGFLSPSSILRIMKAVTSGTIKSLAGLDDIMVEKGRDNFQRMKMLVQIFAAVANKVGPSQQEEIDKLYDEIDKVEKWHKIDFAHHLKLGLVVSDSESTACCTCIQCGFHSDDEHTCCAEGKDNSHLPPCTDCQHGFQVIAKLWDLYRDAEREIRKDREPNIVLLDDLTDWAEQINDCMLDFEDYRAHITHKADDQEFQRDYMDEQLREHGYYVKVTWDYKQKCQPMFFRENQKLYFGKRGFSLLGAKVEIYDVKEKTKDTQTHLFFSDDSTQDAHACNTARQILYRDILAPLGYKRIHEHIDGAGNFKGNEGKATMGIWEELAGIVVASISQSPPGCGKSPLDGDFGIFQHLLIVMVNSGWSFRSALDLVLILLQNPHKDLKGFYYHLHRPDRSYKLVGKSDILHSRYFLERAIRNDETGMIIKYHGRHGEGKFIPYSELEVTKLSVDLEEDGDSTVEETDTIEEGLKNVEGIDFVALSRAFAHVQAPYEEDLSLPDGILLSNFPFEDVQSHDGIKKLKHSEQSTAPFMERKALAQKDRLTVNNDRRAAEIAETRQKQ